MEDYDKIKNTLAVAFMHDLDANRPEWKTCLSNGECADIDKAFNEQDWSKLARYLDKYTESEDERIMKSLIELVEQFMADERKEKTLDWLEKQKEKKPEIKYVYPKFRKGDVIEPITPNGHFTPVRVVNIYDGSYSCRSDDDKAHLSLPIKYEDEYRLVEQKPAEWSEEDEEIRDNIICILQKDVTYTPPTRPNSCTGSGNAFYTHQTEIDWLKSLRPSWKPSDGQKQALERAIDCLEGEYCDHPEELDSLLNDLNKL